MKAVNLLPPERRGIRRSSRLSPLVREPMLIAVVALAVLVVAFLGFAAHSASSKVTSKTQALEQLDTQLTKLETAAPAATGAGPSRAAALTTLAVSRTTWDGFLGTLSRVVPEDVWLLSLSAQGTAAAPTTPTTPATPTTGASPTPAPLGGPVTFTGYTYSQPSVARMMRRLSIVPWLQDVNLVTSTKSSINDHTVYQFTFGANFNPLPEVGT
jgi:Tfp pilus assembly protein PilN